MTRIALEYPTSYKPPDHSTSDFCRNLCEFSCFRASAGILPEEIRWREAEAPRAIAFRAKRSLDYGSLP
jgi:hypothetical protein